MMTLSILAYYAPPGLNPTHRCWGAGIAGVSGTGCLKVTQMWSGTDIARSNPHS